ncbi:MAG: polysaccharide biosynthesis/export family protein [Verrucomicrobiota bacterium]|jgi:polysaccharide export outer membrane protein
MKLFCTLLARGLPVCGLLLAGLILAGCSSPSDEALFSDMPNPAAMSGQPPANGSAADAARFQVGDTVNVTLSGLPVDIPPHHEPIKEDGSITMPDIGKVQAAGKTAGELQNEIHDLYVPRYYTHITVTVNIGDRVYYVSGEVKNPGREMYVGQTTVNQAITSAMDFTDFANHKNVVLIRVNGDRTKINVDRVRSGKAEDPPVYPGDQIIVHRRIW